MKRLTSTLSINFYCRESKKGKDGLSPVEMGLNINGERFFVNLTRKADSGLFQRAITSRKTNPLKEHLSAIEGSLRAFETKLLSEGKPVCADAFKEFIRNGYTSPTENVGYFFSQFHTYILNKGISDGVVRKYEFVWELFKERCHIADGDFLDSITKGKIRDFAEYIERNYKGSSASGMLTRLKASSSMGKRTG